MAPLFTKSVLALALLTTVLAAIVVPEVVQPSVDDKALVLRNSLAIKTPEWNGDSSILIPRRNAVALFGTTVAALGAVVVGACSSPFSALLGGEPCVAAVAAAVIVTVVGAFATAIAAFSKKREDIPLDTYFTFHYPVIESGQSSFQRWQQAYDIEFADGLPVLVAQTNCNGQYDTCHKLWYSKSTYVKNGQNHTYHRVTATPHHHDYRTPMNATKATSALYPRQTTEDDSSAQENDGSTLYGGYVWEEGDHTTLEDLYNEGSSQSDTANDITTDILTTMNKENEAGGKYNDEGVYCQDWASTADSSPGSLGYLWYYKDQSDYPSSEEDALLQTCSEQASDPAEK